MDIIVHNYFMVKMETKIFMLYGAHDIKVMYGLKNFKNCINQFRRIVKRNRLRYKDIISIIENSIIDSTRIGIDPKTSPEEYVKRKTELEEIALQKFFKMEESLFSTIINKFRRKSEGHDDFEFQLIKFLKKKGVMILFEENNSEVVKKENEYMNKNPEEILIRVFKSSHEVDDLRDKLMVKQIKQLSQKHPDKHFLIVRGGLHNKLSDYLRQVGFNVSEYTFLLFSL